MRPLQLEMLYPEIANLFGDTQNLRYLALCLPEAELVRSSLNEEPAFLRRRPDLIYLGPMTENGQRLALERLLSHRERIAELIADGTVFLCTGNALELFGERIVNPVQDYELEGLGLFSLRSELALFDRLNSKVLGRFDTGASDSEPITLVGFKSQFSQVYGDNTDGFFLRCTRGVGLNRSSALEGVRRNNFFGTSLLGPMLILNPPFVRYLIELLLPTGEAPRHLAFEQVAQQAYEERLREFEDPRTSGFASPSSAGAARG
ncbi:MAG: glutamine amidotransferase [Coriobacteriales bacterium]|jgi:CobQ-like glutamine amidotransferase family enzyme|nr:glutamine amidotransferase [Coriobacteriales bacterium]